MSTTSSLPLNPAPPCEGSCESTPAPEPATLILEPDDGSVLDGFVGGLATAWHFVVDNPVLLAFFCAALLLGTGYAAYKVYRNWRSESTQSLKGLLRENTQRIVVSGVAASAAWVVADLLGSAVPAFATFAALLTVQLSLGGSLKVALETIAGTTAALVIAEITVAQFGTGPITVLSVVTAALIVSWLLNLGQDGGVWLATTALFAAALGPALNETAAADRIAVLVIGAVIGVSLSPLAHPASPLKQARLKLEELSDAIAEVVDACSIPEMSVEERRDWVERSSKLNTLVEEARVKVEDAVQTSKLNPARKVKTFKNLETRLRALTFAAVQAQGLARDLLEANSIGKELPPNINAAVAAAGEVMSAYPTGKDLTQALDKAKIAQRYAAAELKDLDDTRMLALAGSVLVDVSRIVSEADSKSAEVPVSQVTPTVPEVGAAPVAAEDPNESTPTLDQTAPEEAKEPVVGETDDGSGKQREEEMITIFTEAGWFVAHRPVGDEPE